MNAVCRSVVKLLWSCSPSSSGIAVLRFHVCPAHLYSPFNERWSLSFYKAFFYSGANVVVLISLFPFFVLLWPLCPISTYKSFNISCFLFIFVWKIELNRNTEVFKQRTIKSFQLVVFYPRTIGKKSENFYRSTSGREIIAERFLFLLNLILDLRQFLNL